MTGTDRAEAVTELAAAAAGRIRQRVGGRLSGLGVAVEGGGLVLDGVADCYHVRQLAVVAARAATGLPVRADRIRVVPQPTPNGVPGGPPVGRVTDRSTNVSGGVG